MVWYGFCTLVSSCVVSTAKSTHIQNTDPKVEVLRLVAYHIALWEVPAGSLDMYVTTLQASKAPGLPAANLSLHPGTASLWEG